jgi:SpoVK/Ycf46/Vps4 family AAA+-type ATPase
MSSSTPSISHADLLDTARDLQLASTVLTRAVQFDAEGKFTDAVREYRAAHELMCRHAERLPDPQSNARLLCKLADIVARVSDILKMRRQVEATAARSPSQPAASRSVAPQIAPPPQQAREAPLTSSSDALLPQHKCLVRDPGTITWDDIVGADDLKVRLRSVVMQVRNFRGVTGRGGLSAPRGVLLYGPPGTGKSKLL